MNARHREDDIDDSQTTNIISFPRHGEVPTDEPDHLALEHEHGCLCDSVREFERTPNSILDTLDIELLLGTANCPKAPPWLLNKLADSYWKEVRTAVANNPKALIYTLLKLSYDFDADVRYQLAENSNLPMQILKILERDENPFVSYRANLTACKRRD
jgi:hypothetical protein